MFAKYLNVFFQSFYDYWDYLIHELLNPAWNNYFYWLLGISLGVYVLELILPWRKGQPRVRKDFWLDAFYMFFNFFLFSLIGFAAISNVFVELFNDFLASFGLKNIVAVNIVELPVWTQLLILFVVKDFIGYNIHRLLHRVPFLWEFHKIHHSVKQMGFAAHLRFHWMENVVYKSIEYIPLAMIGFGIQDFFIVHIFALAIGHLNHANINLNYGPLKYIFNNPGMHIWHHAKNIPAGYGINFGLSLSIWDYLFNTAHVPSDGRDIELGFDGDDVIPANFLGQEMYPMKRR